jgi:pimeloyl-ACP methyl ester carboxylesterase
MRSAAVVGFAWALLLGVGCGVEVTPDPTDNAGPTMGAREDLGSDLPAEVTSALSSNNALSADLLDRIFTIEHQVPVGSGLQVHVTETFTLRAWLRFPHRGLLMLPGPLVKGDFYNIDVDGYRGRDLIARRGFFALTVDHIGSGASTFPANGRMATQDIDIAAMKAVINRFAATRLIPKMDVLGESWGGGVGAEVCADRARVKSCILASMLYKTPSDFANMTFRSPAFRAFLESLPDGYLTTMPETYFPIIANSPPDVVSWTQANQPGRYTIVPLLDVFDLPFFDPTIARVPGRIIQGELDPNQSLDDTRELARDYDRHGAELVVIPGAGHIPRVEAAPKSDLYWRAVVEFIDP